MTSQHQAFFVEDPSLAANKTDAEGLRDRLMIAFSRLNTICSEANTNSKHAAAKSHSATASKPLSAENAESSSSSSEKKTSEKVGEVAETELEFTVPIGDLGIGLVIVHDSTSSYVVIKGFRAMPYKKQNPAEAAGLRVNDRIRSINGSILTDHNHAVNLIRNAVGEIKLVVIRKQ